MEERWKVYEYLDVDGKSPLRRWLDSREVSKIDRARVSAKIENIKTISDDLPPKWFDRYKSTYALSELRVTGERRKMLRPLGLRTDKRKILFFTGAIEKGNKLDTGEAERLWRDWKDGKGSESEL